MNEELRMNNKEQSQVKAEGKIKRAKRRRRRKEEERN
jgi:hypothetical protein